MPLLKKYTLPNNPSAAAEIRPGTRSCPHALLSSPAAHATAETGEKAGTVIRRDFVYFQKAVRNGHLHPGVCNSIVFIKLKKALSTVPPGSARERRAGARFRSAIIKRKDSSFAAGRAGVL